jgi:hypothetical protein
MAKASKASVQGVKPVSSRKAKQSEPRDEETQSQAQNRRGGGRKQNGSDGATQSRGSNH